MMNMQSVIKINSVVCERLTGKFVAMYGRKKAIHIRSKKVVENHIVTGKFVAVKVKI